MDSGLYRQLFGFDVSLGEGDLVVSRNKGGPKIDPQIV